MLRELNKIKYSMFFLELSAEWEKKLRPYKKAKDSFMTGPKYVRPTSITLSSASSSV